MRHQFSFVVFALIAGLIIIQHDVDGEALIVGFMGLRLAFFACLLGMVWSAAGALRISFTREDV